MSGSIKVINRTKVGLTLKTSTACSGTVHIMPGEEGKLEDLFTGIACNPRQVKISPMRFWESSPEREHQHRLDLAAKATLEATFAGSSCGDMFSRLGHMIANPTKEPGENDTPPECLIYYDGFKDAVKLTVRVHRLQHAVVDNVDVSEHPVFYAKGGVDFETESPEAAVYLERA